MTLRNISGIVCIVVGALLICITVAIYFGVIAILLGFYTEPKLLEMMIEDGSYNFFTRMVSLPFGYQFLGGYALMFLGMYLRSALTWTELKRFWLYSRKVWVEAWTPENRRDMFLNKKFRRDIKLITVLALLFLVFMLLKSVNYI